MEKHEDDWYKYDVVELIANNVEHFLLENPTKDFTHDEIAKHVNLTPYPDMPSFDYTFWNDVLSFLDDHGKIEIRNFNGEPYYKIKQ